MLKRSASCRSALRGGRAAGPTAGEGWLTPQIVDLLETITGLRSVDEAERFFRDLCTIPELHTLAARWEVVKLLEQGVPYSDIARRTGASTATITRINTWRRYGTGGYRLQLNRRRGRGR